MSEPFEGSVSNPEDEPLDPTVAPELDTTTPAPATPLRPVLIELAAAILIVGGITAIVGFIVGQLVGPLLLDPGLPSFALVAINVVGIVIGVVIRNGRYWRACINIVAISLLVYATAFPNPIATFYLVLDAVVLYALIRHRAWFDRKPATTSGVA